MRRVFERGSSVHELVYNSQYLTSSSKHGKRASSFARNEGALFRNLGYVFSSCSYSSKFVLAYPAVSKYFANCSTPNPSLINLPNSAYELVKRFHTLFPSIKGR